MTFYHLNLSRSGLPSEALEEFLSILRPSFFPPTSPILRTRRQGASLPTFQHERSFSYKSRGRLEIASQKNDGDDIDISRSTQPSRNTCPSTPDSLNDPDGMTEPDGDSPSLRWFKANILGESPLLRALTAYTSHTWSPTSSASPISRTHTRNPFLRNPSNHSPGPISPLSPAAIPLPLPTADEMMDT